MGKIVSLNKYRKARARAEEAGRAEEKRARFGRSKAEKRRDADNRARHENDVDGRQLDSGEDVEQSD